MKFTSKKAQKGRQTTSLYYAEGSINVRADTLINSVAPIAVAATTDDSSTKRKPMRDYCRLADGLRARNNLL